jgi:uncharacterized protein YbbK (DUF523 family)
VKIAVSKCLLGYECRYDGKSKKDDNILSLANRYRLIPFCPEEEAYGTPRDTIRVEYKNNQLRVVKNIDNTDVTDTLMAEIKKVAKMIEDESIDIVILKSKSPSCGYGSVKIYDSAKYLHYGNGVLAQYLVDNIKDIRLYEERSVDVESLQGNAL